MEPTSDPTSEPAVTADAASGSMDAEAEARRQRLLEELHAARRLYGGAAAPMLRQLLAMGGLALLGVIVVPIAVVTLVASTIVAIMVFDLLGTPVGTDAVLFWGTWLAATVVVLVLALRLAWGRLPPAARDWMRSGVAASRDPLASFPVGLTGLDPDRAEVVKFLVGTPDDGGDADGTASAPEPPPERAPTLAELDARLAPTDGAAVADAGRDSPGAPSP